MNNTYFPNQDLSVAVTYESNVNPNGIDLSSTNYNNYDYAAKFYTVAIPEKGQEPDYATVKPELKFNPKSLTPKKLGSINVLEVICDLRLLSNSPQGYLILEIKDPLDSIVKQITLGKFIRQILP